MSNIVNGTCEKFCPDDEVKLRIRERLLNFYELKDGRKNCQGTLVKCFSRSAAGNKKPKPKDLRTERCLQQTIVYLLKDIVVDKRKSFHYVYDFVFDRMRAVRQEIVIQRFDEYQTLKLLLPIIMFLSYSRYRMCEENIENFDPKICEQHLQECLKIVLRCYDVIERSTMTLNDLRNRNFIESLYQLFNLGSLESYSRCFHLHPDIRNDPLFGTVIKIVMNFHQRNFYRVMKTIKELPHILCAIVVIKLQEMRRKLYEVFSVAYNSKQFNFPVEFLCRLAIHEGIDSLCSDCEYYNIKISNDRKLLNFNKIDFKFDISVRTSRSEIFMEEKLNTIYLPEILLMKKL